MFSHILIPIDLAHPEQLSPLMDSARLLIDGNGTISLLYVDTILVHRSGTPHLGGSNYADHEKQARETLQRLARERSFDNITVNFNIREGSAHDQILEEARETGADAILLMARKPGFSSYFIGSTAERVVRHADCSVFVVRK